MAKSDDKPAADSSRRLRPGDLVQRVPWSELRKQMVTSIGTAFGVLIGFVWTGVVTQAFTAAGLIVAGSVTGWGSWIGVAFGAVLVTIISVFALVIIARYQAKQPQK
ncbi:MAG: DUF5654 family protein [Promethearchaeati archaeon SRVP18_Atabeyarchaeia-1]